MPGNPSRRSRSYSPSTKRQAKRLRLDSSPSAPPESMNPKDDNPLSSSTLFKDFVSTVAHQQQPSSSTSAPAWSADPDPSSEPQLTFGGSSSFATGQPNSNPILTSFPLSLAHDSRPLPERQQSDSTSPSSFVSSAAFFSPDASAATHHTSTASLDILPGSSIRPTFDSRDQSSLSAIIQPVLSYSSQGNSLPSNVGVSKSQLNPHNLFHSFPVDGFTQVNPTPRPFFDILASDFARDALLSHAYRLCNSHNSLSGGLSFMPIPQHSNENPPTPGNPTYITELLSILYSLKEYHPTHLPISLLLGCILHSMGNYSECIEVNLEILQVDPNYVGATRFFIYVGYITDSSAGGSHVQYWNSFI